jgi:hypothetical protein
MTYRDEIVDEVRAIREQLCNRAGSLENLLATLRAEEMDHAGRMAKDLNKNGKIPKSGLYRVNQADRDQKCAEDKMQHGGKPEKSSVGG